MISPNRTVSAVNDLFYGHSDQSTLNNFITDSTWSDDELDRAGEEGISVEVIDLRTLIPLDTDAVLTSIKKTGRVVLYKAPKIIGYGAELADS